MQDRDKRVVESMCLAGMDLDTLYACFPSMDKEEIREVYEKIKKQDGAISKEVNISMNCS